MKLIIALFIILAFWCGFWVGRASVEPEHYYTEIEYVPQDPLPHQPLVRTIKIYNHERERIL